MRSDADFAHTNPQIPIKDILSTSELRTTYYGLEGAQRLKAREHQAVLSSRERT
jgi:hypothetical protein